MHPGLALSMWKKGSRAHQQGKSREKENCKVAVPHQLLCPGQGPVKTSWLLLWQRETLLMEGSKCGCEEVKLLLEVSVISVSLALPLVAAGAANLVLQNPLDSDTFRKENPLLRCHPHSFASASGFFCPCGKADPSWLCCFAEANYQFSWTMDIYLCNCCECLKHYVEIDYQNAWVKVKDIMKIIGKFWHK